MTNSKHALQRRIQLCFLALALVAAGVWPGRAADVSDEKALQESMKEVGQIARRFKKSTEDKDSAALSKDATRLAELYKDTIAFWKNRKMDDAVKITEESVVAAKNLAATAKGGDWEKVRPATGGVMKNCKACHEAHREEVEKGVYKIK